MKYITIYLVREDCFLTFSNETIKKRQMETIRPRSTGIIVKINSTHCAIRVNNEIQIWLLGFDIEDIHSEPEYLYSIPAENKDDLFAIFEGIAEESRCLRSEFC